MVGQQREIPGDPVVELFLAEGGLQVDLHMVAVLFHIPQMAGGAEGQGAADAEMGEQHLPLLLKDGLVVLKEGELDVFQGEAHHLFAVGVFGHQAHQAGHRLNDGVAGLPGQLVAVAGGTGHRIAEAAGGHQDAVGPVAFARRSLYSHAAEGRALFGLFALGRSLLLHRLQQQRRRPVVDQVGAGGIVQQGLADFCRLVRHREHPAPPLHLQGHTQALKQLLGFGRREGVEGGIQKPGVGSHMAEKFLLVAVVGQVAAALAGDQDFLAWFVGVLQQCNLVPLPCSGAGGHQSSRPRPHDQNFRHG